MFITCMLLAIAKPDFPEVFSFKADPVPSKVVEVPVADATKPEEFKVAIGRQKRLRIPADSKPVKWMKASEGLCDATFIGDECVFSSPVPGRYLLIASTNEQSWLIAITVEGKTPDVVVPPKPVDPPAADPLETKLIESFNSDNGALAQKKKDALQLADLYELAAGLCDPATRAKEKITTLRELLTKVRNAGDQLTADRLTSFRTILRNEMESTLGDLDAKLTDENCSKASKLFKKAATILETLGK